MPAIVRKTIEQVGYINADYGFDYRTCGVVTSIGKQSPDIDMGVSNSMETKVAHLSDDELERVGAGDQGMMIGFACNETPEYMPMPISLAHKLTRQLSQVRRRSWGGTGPMVYLRPDGNSQVTVHYEHGRPVRVDTIVISTQHASYIDHEQIRLAKVLQGSYERLVALQPLIPPSELSGEGRRDKDLVDGCVEAHPFKPFRECLGVLREQLGPVRVLEIPDPIRHTEVAQIYDESDLLLMQHIERFIREAPVVFARTGVGRVIGWAVAQSVQAKFANELEILFPLRVVPALRHLVDARAGCQGRIAVLDARGKEKWSLHVGAGRLKCARETHCCE